MTVRARYEKSGLTLDELGDQDGLSTRVGPQERVAILNKTNDPRLSMLRKFAAAVGCSVKSLF